MPTARSKIMDAARPGSYHLVSRCVRRAFLCGDGLEHRRQWVEKDLTTYAACFAIDLNGYSVMSNHLHLVVRNRPDLADEWKPRTVVERWAPLFPKHDEDGTPRDWTDGEIIAEMRRPGRVDELRARLANPSWLMKILKERIAKRANREDGTTGHFWEGRFKSVALLDQAALLSAMVYVDLNPIRAGIATVPEDSLHTSIHERIQARLTGTAPTPTRLVAIEDCIIGEALANKRLTLETYLELVDATGRVIIAGKRGAIPAHLRPILERLDLDHDNWAYAMGQTARMLGTAIGSAAARTREAARRGVDRIVDKAKFYSDRAPPGGCA